MKRTRPAREDEIANPDEFSDSSSEKWIGEEIVTIAHLAEDEPASDPASLPEVGPFLRRLRLHTGKDRGLELLEEIGRGGMGSVIRVKDEILRRHLAMKIMTDRPPDPERGVNHRLGRFLEEAQITAQLDHPGIVPVHDLGVDDQGRVYFTMKLVRGRDLQQIIALSHRKHERWTQTRILHTLLRACEALSFAHRKGVIHRDLKPSNIMVGRYGETYVMDWGLARVREGGPHSAPTQVTEDPRDGAALSAISSDRKAMMEDGKPLTIDGQVLGTPAFMAPEQASANHQDVGPHSDVYSMGAILYHVLSGRAPYQPADTNLSPYLVLRFVVEGPPTALRTLCPNTPPELISICEKAMARKPIDRYASMEAFGDDLRAYLEHRVVRAYAVGAGAELQKWVVRNRSSAWIAAAALLTIAVGTGFFMFRLSEGAETARASEALANARSIEADRLRAEAEDARLLNTASSDPFVLRAAELRMDELWPVHPSMEPALAQWIESTAPVRQRAELYQRYLADPANPVIAARCEEALAAIHAFSGSEERPGPLRVVQRRMERGAGLHAESIDAHRSEWDDAIAEIADPVRAPLYAGLKLTPQLGLVPLGPDPRSGLWEFWHVLSGDRPVRAPDGRFVMTSRTGIVLVLLPGAIYSMGAELDDEDAPGYDPAADDDEYFVHDVQLDPFLLSKYELTLGQLARALSLEPDLHDGVPAMPAANLSWYDYTSRLARLGLVLPTEAQWEYGARGGSREPWVIPGGRTHLDRFANLCDAQAVLRGMEPRDDDLDDGFALHAPVGSFDPNLFGLHDVLGNVMEWTQDEYRDYRADLEPGTGRRLGPAMTPEKRVVRGWSYGDLPADARVARRIGEEPMRFSQGNGVRPARAIDR